MTTHRKTSTREYNVWTRIKRICYKPKTLGYSKYGKKGVRVCERWLESFTNFLEDMGEMPKDCTGLELLNPEGNFEKHNCKWVNWKTRSKKAKRNKDTTIATFTLSTDHYNYLSKLAVMKSKETGKRYTLSQFIRELLERHAPNPKTHDMFGGKK